MRNEGKTKAPGKSGRRTFLTKAAAIGTAGLSANLAHAQESDGALIPGWMKVQGRPVLNHTYGEPSPYESRVVRTPFPGLVNHTAGASLTPLHRLHGIFTPNGLVFERHHGGIPDIPPDQHKLLVHGMVQRPLVFSMDDITRFPAVSRAYFLECSGNTSMEWHGSADTVQTTHGLLSCCEWTGVPLALVLQEAGLDARATWILAEGADAAAMSRSIPIDKALDDALLVYAQNGEMLRPEQGYPLRLFLPGFEGNMSVKWLRRLKLADQPFMTREETSKYTDLMPDGKARQFSFVMEAKSVIIEPSGGSVVPTPGFVEIRGLAWSGRGRIRHVDVSTDGGRTWERAHLQDPLLSKCLTVFRLPWRWDGAPAVLQSRAEDETGYVQPSRDALITARGLHSHYHYNAIHAWRIDAGGRVENARA